jgi:cytochrome c-type biogenesis protein CcmH
MTAAIVSLILCAVIVMLTASPLFRKSADRPLGTGVEDDSPIRRWQEEKNRLTAQLRDNDMALAEGRIDEAAHATIASRLAGEAEQALTRLREARQALSPVAEETARPAGRPAAVAAAAFVVAAAYGVHVFASRGDTDMTRQTAQAPPQAATAKPDGGAGMPTGADGAPDIAAMVARLEARIAGGNYTPDDTAMLLRSYRVLGRDSDAKALLAKAAKAFPGDLRLKLTFVETAFGGSDPAALAEAQKMVADMLAAQPDLPEARWYRSLFLVRQGDLEGARKELRALQPLVAGNPEASQAVASLLARLDIPEHSKVQSNR